MAGTVANERLTSKGACWIAVNIPGVKAADYVDTLPFSLESEAQECFHREAQPICGRECRRHSHKYDVSPEYLTAAGTSLLAGERFHLAGR